MKAIAVGSMRPKAAGSGERTSVGVRSGSVRLGILGFAACGLRQLRFAAVVTNLTGVTNLQSYIPTFTTFLFIIFHIAQSWPSSLYY